MAEAKKGRLFDLPETKGAFQLKGIVSGVEKDSFYKEIKTKTGKDMKIANFGIEYESGHTLFETVQGMEQDKVYFSKRAEEKGGKSVTEAVAWGNRFTFSKEGFRLIGNNIGVTKKINSEGKAENDKKVLTDYDTCIELKKNLKDGASVFTRGSISFSSFVDDKGNKRASVKLVPNQISLCADIDFTDDKFTKQNDFNQTIVFTGISQEKDNDKPTGRFVVDAKIVTYSTIEDVEFIIVDDKLANLFKKNLKPYTAIKVNGHMCSSVQAETVNEDSWGEEDAISKVSASTKRELIITGATPSTIDKETYSEDKIETALAAIYKATKAENDFGSDSDWGDTSALDDASDDDSWD